MKTKFAAMFLLTSMLQLSTNTIGDIAKAIPEQNYPNTFIVETPEDDFTDSGVGCVDDCLDPAK